MLMREGNENTFETFLDRFAGMVIQEALNLTGGNRTEPPSSWVSPRPTLLSKIEKYRIKIETTAQSDSD